MNMEQDFSSICYQTCFEGRMTSETIEDLRSDWMEKLDRYLDMVIDLSGAECIDLSGVSLMLWIQKKAEFYEKHVDFIGGNPAVDEALYIYRLFADLVRKGNRSSLTLAETQHEGH